MKMNPITQVAIDKRGNIESSIYRVSLGDLFRDSKYLSGRSKQFGNNQFVEQKYKYYIVFMTAIFIYPI